jgi:hypothetical protein
MRKLPLEEVIEGEVSMTGVYGQCDTCGEQYHSKIQRESHDCLKLNRKTDDDLLNKIRRFREIVLGRLGDLHVYYQDARPSHVLAELKPTKDLILACDIIEYLMRRIEKKGV